MRIFTTNTQSSPSQQATLGAIDRAMQGLLGYADTAQQRSIAEQTQKRQEAESRRRWDIESDQRQQAYDIELQQDLATIAAKDPALAEEISSLPSVRARLGQASGGGGMFGGGAPAGGMFSGGSPAPRFDASRMGNSGLIPTTRMDLPPAAPAPRPEPPFGPPSVQTFGSAPTGTATDTLLPDPQVPGGWMMQPTPDVADGFTVRQQQFDTTIPPRGAGGPMAGAIAAGRQRQMSGIEGGFGAMAEDLGAKVTPVSLPSALVAVDQAVDSHATTRPQDRVYITEMGERVKASLRTAAEARGKAAEAEAQYRLDLAAMKAKARPRSGGKGPSRDDLLKQAYQLRTSGLGSSDPAERVRLLASADKIDQRLGLPVGSGNTTTVEHERRAYAGTGSINEPGAGKGAKLDEQTQQRLIEAAGQGAPAVRKVLETIRPGANITDEEVKATTQEAQQQRAVRDKASTAHAEAVRRFTAQPTEQGMRAVLRLGQLAGITDADKKLREVLKAKRSAAAKEYSAAEAAASKARSNEAMLDPADRTPEVVADVKAKEAKAAAAKAALDNVTALSGMGASQ